MPASIDSQIQITISAVTGQAVNAIKSLGGVTGILGGFFKATEKTVSAFNHQVNDGARLMSTLESAIGGVVGSFIGFQAAKNAVNILKEAGDAATAFADSLAAANAQMRNFGAVTDWEAALNRLSEKLVVFSDTTLRNAIAQAINMSQQMNFSREQIEKLVEAAGNLSGGDMAKLPGIIQTIMMSMRGMGRGRRTWA